MIGLQVSGFGVFWVEHFCKCQIQWKFSLPTSPNPETHKTVNILHNQLKLIHLASNFERNRRAYRTDLPISNILTTRENMKGFIIGFLLLLAYAIPARWYFVCQLRHQCGDEPALVPPTRPMTLSLYDGDKAILQGYEQFGFAPNAIQPDLSPNNQAFLAKVAEYLKANPDKKITLTGRFLPAESTAKSGIFENLGIARAVAVEQLLAKLGVDEKRFSIDYQKVTGTTLEEPISFHLFTPKPNDYDHPVYSFKDNTFSDANFAFGSDEFKPGEQCILYADSVKTYLSTNPTLTLTITGHTDSIGGEKINLNLGLRRAKNAAAYFRELGVKSEIVSTTKGEEMPVAPNSLNGKDNPDGRQKNRRVNFKLEEKTAQ